MLNELATYGKACEKYVELEQNHNLNGYIYIKEES